MFSNFYGLDINNKICVVLADLCYTIGRNHVETETSLDLVMFIEVHICWLFDSTHMSSQVCSLLSVE
jgi:hypothetical protein